jgi:hypothetical protein
MEQQASLSARVAASARDAADALQASGAWTAADDLAMDAAFSTAATAALAVPSFAERAMLLRRIAGRVVPRRLRPLLGRLARRADALARRVAR